MTALLDEHATAWFEAMRRQQYPADRNRVPAHVMLFHHLPYERRSAVAHDLREIAAAQRAFEMTVREPRSIGSGVVYDLDSPDLQAVRAALAARLDDDLVAQDRERYRPHVVVQNKVAPATARKTLAVLRAAARPATARATGIVLWTYRSGAWSEPQPFAFEETELPSVT